MCCTRVSLSRICAFCRMSKMGSTLIWFLTDKREMLGDQRTARTTDEGIYIYMKIFSDCPPEAGTRDQRKPKTKEERGRRGGTYFSEERDNRVRDSKFPTSVAVMRSTESSLNCPHVTTFWTSLYIQAVIIKDRRTHGTLYAYVLSQAAKHVGLHTVSRECLTTRPRIAYMRGYYITLLLV